MDKQGFGITKHDHHVMSDALKSAGLDESKHSEVLNALLKAGYMLIDSSTYSDMYIGANTYGMPS